MADGHILRGVCKRLYNNVLFSNFNDDFNQIDCTNAIHDGKRFKWISNWETLKNFIEYSLQLKGKWTSPGGSSRKFTFKNLDLTITMYPGKQNSLMLHGTLSTNLSNILLIACQKKTNISLVEINASPKSPKIDNLTSIPGYKSAPKLILVTDKCESESTCLRPLCNLQCDCKCSC